MPTTEERKPGRPSLLTPERQETICATLRVFGTVAMACKRAGIDDSTYYKWMEKGRVGEPGYVEFFNAVEKAKADGQTLALAEIVKAGKKQWQANAWLLERTMPQDFGRKDRLDLGNADGKPLEIAVTTVSMNDLVNDDEGRALLSSLAARLCPANGDAADPGVHAD